MGLSNSNFGVLDRSRLRMVAQLISVHCVSYMNVDAHALTVGTSRIKVGG
jgi:hypothetical protein